MQEERYAAMKRNRNHLTQNLQGWVGNEDDECFIEIDPIMSEERKTLVETTLRILTLALIWTMAFT